MRKSVDTWLDRFAYDHPRFGIPHLINYILVGNVVVYLLDMFSNGYATMLLGLDFAGVDVLFGRDGPLLCEVNSNAHFKTTLECTGVNMAVEIMRHIARRLEG